MQLLYDLAAKFLHHCQIRDEPGWIWLQWIFFPVCAVFLGTFFFNLICAIVAMSYDEMQRQAEEKW